MFFVELNEQEEVAEEDEIDKSIQEIHQSAQNLSDSIVHIAGASSSFKLSEDENFLISGDIPDKGKDWNVPTDKYYMKFLMGHPTKLFNPSLWTYIV